jgi:hypothetical protein
MQTLPYSEQNIELMRNVIVNFLNNPEAGFLVKLNESPITPRTREIDLFEFAHNQINEFTQTFTLIVYPNKSYNPIQYTLYMQGYDKGMNGTEVKSGAADMAELRRQITVEVEYSFLKKENETLKRENNYLRRNLDEVERMVKESKANKGTDILDRLLALVPMFAGNPNLPAPAETSNTEQPVEGVPVSTVKAKGEQNQSETTSTKATEIARALVRYFSDHELEQIFETLATLRDHKELIPALAEWLAQVIEQRKQFFEQMAAASRTPQTPQPVNHQNNAENEELPANV